MCCQHREELRIDVHCTCFVMDATRRFTEAGSKHLNIVSFTREHRNTQTDLGRNKFLNTKYNEFNIAAISLLWHAPPVLCCGQFNVADIRRR